MVRELIMPSFGWLASVLAGEYGESMVAYVRRVYAAEVAKIESLTRSGSSASGCRDGREKSF